MVTTAAGIVGAVLEMNVIIAPAAVNHVGTVVGLHAIIQNDLFCRDFLRLAVACIE